MPSLSFCWEQRFTCLQVDVTLLLCLRERDEVFAPSIHYRWGQSGNTGAPIQGDPADRYPSIAIMFSSFDVCFGNGSGYFLQTDCLCAHISRSLGSKVLSLSLSRTLNLSFLVSTSWKSSFPHLPQGGRIFNPASSPF